MRVLIVKTSSMGDVIHTLPAVTDAQRCIPDIRFDWVVEEGFSQIPSWHPAVEQVIPVAIRRWRKRPVHTWLSGQWRHFKQQLQARTYDAVIDAQGLLKSALVTRLAKGPSFGLDKSSAREPLSSRFYDHPQSVAKGQHAVERVRQLFAQSLGYSLEGLSLDYGVRETLNTRALPAQVALKDNSIVLFHSTTWLTKHWPEAYWIELAKRLQGQGFQVLLPWGNEQEAARAARIAKASGAEQLPALTLEQLAVLLAHCGGCVALDTGLAHLAAALDVPTVALFGPTDPGLTGTYGNHQVHLRSHYHCAPCLSKQCKVANPGDELYPPCFRELTPEHVAQLITTHSEVAEQEQDSQASSREPGAAG